MTIKEVLDRSTVFFKDKNFDSPRLDAEILIASALKLKRIDLYLKFDQQLKENELSSCRELVKRRSQGEPVAYILNEKYFYGEIFFVDKNVLIPRPETEQIVEIVLAWIKKDNQPEKIYSILDLGCGSGCIGLSLGKKISNSKITLCDSSVGAIQVATLNCEKVGIKEKTSIICQDVMDLDPDGKKFDIIVANPPYISADDNLVDENVKKFEPHSALFAKNNGLDCLFNWPSKFIHFLNANSLMCFEFGFGQSEKVKNHFAQLRFFDKVYIEKDLSSIDRIIVGQKQESQGD